MSFETKTFAKMLSNTYSQYLDMYQAERLIEHIMNEEHLEPYEAAQYIAQCFNKI